MKKHLNLSEFAIAITLIATNVSASNKKLINNDKFIQTQDATKYVSNRPSVANRLFVSVSVENEIERVSNLLKNEKLRWMFSNCFPNTLETTVYYRQDKEGDDDTVVYTS